MMDIRKKLFLLSKLLHPNGATHISDGEQHFGPTLSLSCAPASCLAHGICSCFPQGKCWNLRLADLSCKAFPLAERKVGAPQGPWQQTGLLIFSSCPQRLGLSSPDHVPRKPQELHHCLQPHQDDIHLWTSQASDFHSRGMTGLPFLENTTAAMYHSSLWSDSNLGS